jgi:predicted permease
MRMFFRDLSLSLRLVFKRPGFTAIIVLTLGLAIGVNSAIFSLYNSVMLRPLPVKEASRLIRLQKSAKDGLRQSFSYPEYSHFRDHNRVFSALAAQSWDQLSYAEESSGHFEEISALNVSSNYFSMFVSGMHLGRSFLQSEDRPGSNPVVILSYRFWERRFGADPGVLGTSVLLNERSFTVVGVCSKTFRGFLLHTPDVFVPLAARAVLKPASLNDPGSAWLQLFAVQRPGLAAAEAQSQLDAVGEDFRRTYAKPNEEWKVVLTPLQINGPAAFEIIILMSAVALVLLIACVNVSNLILARANSRRKEFALRAAVGASRGRLVRLCLAESLVLGLLAAGFGMLAGHWMAGSLLAVTEVLPDVVLTPDWRVFAHALALCVVTILGCGLSPALRGTRFSVSEVLKEEGIIAGAGARRRRNILVTSQVAASLALLIVGTLFLKSLYHARYADSGINTEGVIELRVNLKGEGQPNESEPSALHNELIARLRRVPGSDLLSYSLTVPCGNRSAHEQVTPDLRATANQVSAGYFQVVGMRILKGRDFTEYEVQAQARSAIVSESLAERLWPGGNPVGQVIGTGGTQRAEVIGVVNDTIWDTPRLCVYRPISQQQKSSSTILIRTSEEPAAVMGLIRREVLSLRSDLRPQISQLERKVEEHLRGSKADATAWGALAALSLALAVVGIYGVVSYATSQRTREVGIRIALGATPAGIVRAVIFGGLRPVLFGSAIGILLAAVASRFFVARLHGLSPLDPVVYLGVSLFLASVALLATYLPARRAARTDPLDALRCN